MSSWDIGAKHDSDLVHALKQQLLAKDAQYQTLQTQLLKREEDIRGMKASFDDAVVKLQREADRALRLDDTLKQYTEDLQNERITRQNTEVALSAVQDRIKASEQTAREYQAIIDKLSSTADSSSSDKFKLEQEVLALQSRVRELQHEVHAKEQLEQALLKHGQTSNASPAKDARGRRRSSSVSSFKVTALEQEVADLRTLNTQQASELRSTAGRLAKAQASLLQIENEKIAVERKLQRELEEMRASMEEQREEVKAMGMAGGNDAALRERELIERLEEEESRVQALESELQRSVNRQKKEVEFLKEELSKTSDLLETEKTKAAEMQGQLTLATRERQEAIKARDRVRVEVDELKKHIRTLGPQQSTTSTPVETSVDPAFIAQTGKLLQAIERLRGERDELRGHLEFVQAESKFKTESLEAELAQRSSSSNESQLKEQLQVVSQSSARSDQVATTLAVVIQHIDAQHIQDLTRNEEQSKEMVDLRTQLHQAHAALEHGLQDRVQQIQAELDDTLAKLNAAESQTAAFRGTVHRLEEEAARERSSHEETGNSLAEAESHLAELAKALADAEAARDAVSLERTHLEQDLASAREELAEADKRYGHQLNAMTSHDSSRALRAQIEALEQRVLRRTEQVGVHQHDIKRLETNLRLQEERIAEMAAELEVAQAERAAMVEDCRTTREERDDATARREFAEEQAEAVDEARDTEVTTMVEIVFAALAKHRSSARRLDSLMAAHLNAKSASTASLSAAEETNTRLLQQVSLSQQECDRLTRVLEEKVELLQTLEQERTRTSAEAESAAHALSALREELRESKSCASVAEEGKLALQTLLDSTQQKLQDTLVELANSHEELDSLRSRLSQTEEEIATAAAAEKAELQKKVQELEKACGHADALYQETMQKLTQTNEELQSHISKSAEHLQAEEVQRAELDRLQAQYSEDVAGLNAEIARLTGELEALQKLQAVTSVSHEEATQELIRSKDELEKQLAEAKEALQTGVELSEEMAQMKARHEDELRSMEERLAEVTLALQGATKEHEEAQVRNQGSLDELARELADKSEQLQQKVSLEAELTQIRAEHADQVKSLQAEIELIRAEAQDASAKEIEALKGQLELTKAQLQEASDSETKLLQSQLEKVEAQLNAAEAAKAASAKEVEDLQAQLDAVRTQLHESEGSQVQLDAQLQQLSVDHARAVEELQSRLDAVVEECTQVKTRLQDAVDEHSREQDQHRSELEKAIETLQQSEAVREKALQELSDVSLKLEEAEISLKTLQEQQTSTQFEVTNLEAEIQRSKSLQRFQEKQIQESENRLVSLAMELEQARADCLKAEKAMKASESALTVQSIQHEQQLSGLRLELKSLQTDGRLADTVAELKEQNKDMEDLLRSKCQEIEDNDDRFIEMLKEKKKLNSKIDSLTKKVNHLQAKLAAAVTETTPTPTLPAPNPLPEPSQQTVFSHSKPLSPQAVVPPSALVRPAVPGMSSSTSSGSSRQRTMSTSTVTRPKTPEAKASQPVVFRARTPEPKRAPQAPEVFSASNNASSSSSSSVSIGKKRPAPDDFETCETMPAQMFTAAAESFPTEGSHSGTTPRVRRAVHAVRTGFTPVRGRIQDVHRGSPRRATTGAHTDDPMAMPIPMSMPPSITDVTNSPRGKADQKSTTARRGWLGKIRATPSQTQRTMPSSSRPPVFERPQR